MKRKQKSVKATPNGHMHKERTKNCVPTCTQKLPLDIKC